MENFISNSLKEAEQTLQQFLQDEKNISLIEKSIELFVATFNQKGRVYSCGNGGSMCDAMHFAEELTGRYRKDRAPLAAMAINDPGHITCVSNDFGFDHVFSRTVEAFGKEGDTLLAISTSGNSPNVLNAAQVAKKNGVKVVGLTGKTGGKLKDMADVAIIVPTHITDRIQEVHIKLIHIFIEGIERNLFPENYS